MIPSITEALFWSLCLLNLITNCTREDNFPVSLERHTQAGVDLVFLLLRSSISVHIPCTQRKRHCILDEEVVFSCKRRDSWQGSETSHVQKLI